MQTVSLDLVNEISTILLSAFIAMLFIICSIGNRFSSSWHHFC